MPTKRIVCLANSWKTGGTCVAGREVLPNTPPGTYGAWIRPVSDRPSQEVSHEERAYSDGTQPQLLDIIDVPLLEHRPQDHQQENWLLDPSERWKRAGTCSLRALPTLLEPDGSLWSDPARVTAYGVNNHLPRHEATRQTHSLKLIRVAELTLHVDHKNKGRPSAGKRVDAAFAFNDIDYKLKVTDPTVTRRYEDRIVGHYGLGESYLTISLGEDFHGNCYKLVAAILRQDR